MKGLPRFFLSFIVVVPAISGMSHAEKTRSRFQSVPDPELAECFEKLGPDLPLKESAYDFDRCLTEIIHRGGRKWESILQQRLDSMQAARLKMEADMRTLTSERQRVDGSKAERVEARRRESGKYFSIVRNRESTRNCAVLISLRRIQKKTDPVMIVVSEAASKKSHCTFGDWPRFDVSLLNVDVEEQPVIVRWGGPSQNGNPLRWKVEVRDLKGKRVPKRDWKEDLEFLPRSAILFMGRIRGISTLRTLQFGESLKTRLGMGYYVHVDRPGEYTVRILFHNAVEIAHRDDLDGLILARSVPFKFRVYPILISTTQAQRREAAKWIGALPEEGPVVFSTASADSPSRKLLAAGKAGVPELIKAGVSKQTHPVRRAWILAILHTIMGRYAITQYEGIFGPNVRLFGKGAAFGRESGIPWTAYATGRREKREDSIDEKKQIKLAERWQDWLDKGCIKIEEKAE